MRIDLTTALYGKLTGRPKATPRDVLNKRLQEVAGTPKQWIDADMALQDYIAHVGKAFAPSGATMSPDGCVLTLKDNDTEGANIGALTERARAISVKNIIAAHVDDRWVVSPSGRIYGPKRWNDLMDTMNPRVFDALSKAIAPCSCQKFADAYAVVHKKAFGEVWGPYRERSQS